MRQTNSLVRLISWQVELVRKSRLWGALWGSLCRCVLALALFAGMPAMAAEPLAVPLNLDLAHAHNFKMRWPESRLEPENASSMLHVVDADGIEQAAVFVLAPGDVGRTMHPLWLLIHVQGKPPYTMYVNPENGAAPGLPAEVAIAPLAHRLSTLPDVTVHSQYWGPLTSALAMAEQRQQRRRARFNTIVVASAAALGLVLAIIVQAFARRQYRTNDVSRL